MEMYRVEMMSEEDYAKYMSGSNDYNVQTLYTDAESLDHAYQMAKRSFPDLIFDKKMLRV